MSNNVEEELEHVICYNHVQITIGQWDDLVDYFGVFLVSIEQLHSTCI